MKFSLIALILALSSAENVDVSLQFENPPDELQSCPQGWTCTGVAAVDNYHVFNNIQGDQYFELGVDATKGTGTSNAFYLPKGTTKVRFRMAGGAENGGLRVYDASNHAMICEVIDGTDTDTLFFKDCNVEGYDEKLVYLYAWDCQNSGWGKIVIDDIQFLDDGDSLTFTEATISAIQIANSYTVDCENQPVIIQAIEPTAPASPAAPNQLSIGLSEGTGCRVTSIDSSGGTVACDFSSTCTYEGWCGLFSDMVEGTCASTYDTNQVSHSGTKEEAVLTSTASKDFTHQDPTCNQNDGRCTFKFCARADLWGGPLSYEMSLLASKIDVEVVIDYLKTGTFSTTVNTAVFEATDATASDTRSVTLSAALVKENGCADKYGDGETPPDLKVGETARICVEPNDADVKISSLEDVKATYGTSGEQELVTAAGEATFIASVTGQNSADVLLEFLMLPDFYDAGAGTITVTGTANLSYTRRRLNASRNLQGAEENAPFELELTVEKSEMPEIAKADGSSSGFRVVSSVLTLFAGAGVAVL